MDSAGTIDSRKDFDKDPRGQFEFWSEELKASQKARKDWHKQADKIVKRFTDFRKGTDLTPHSAIIPFRLNLFHSNIVTLQSMLYGNLPKVDVSRRYSDPNDDVARVAAEMMERLLNNDVAENGEEYNCVLRSTLQDRLLAGLGCARVRYEVETESTSLGLVDGSGEVDRTTERTTSESAPMDYFHWRDVLWSWGRNWSELSWIAYRVWLNKDECTKLFGEEATKDMQFRKQLVTDDDATTEDPDQSSVWNKTEVWEVWDKVSRKIIFINLKGPDKILDTKDDALGLNGFFPSPPFFIANATTSLYQPTPDYHMAQDLYNEIDKLQSRIAVITEAVKVVGLYDSASTEVARMFKEGVDNTLIPVENWALFAEKGGIDGSIAWVPLADITSALDQLRTLRDETIQLLYQVTGMNDIMRGGSGGQYEGVGQAQLQAKFGSVRVQALQDEFARFASDLLQLKAEIIAKHFDPKTIVQMSNMGKSLDANLVEQAVMLIKNPSEAKLRVAIRPESVAMVDYAQLKSERTDYINALSTFMQSAGPMIESDPASKPFLLQLLQWGLAGFKGASEIEGVIDRAIEASLEEAKQQEGQGQPDPAQIAAQMAEKLEQLKQQGELSKIQAKAQADQQVRQQDLEADIQTAMALHQTKLAEIDAELQATVAETQIKLQADILLEQVQAESNMMQTQTQVQGEIQKDVVEAELDMVKEETKTTNKINEIAASASAKIKEAKAKPKSGSSNDNTD